VMVSGVPQAENTFAIWFAVLLAAFAAIWWGSSALRHRPAVKPSARVRPHPNRGACASPRARGRG
jgi:hypothetical protein